MCERGETYGLFSGGLGGGKSHLLDLGLGGVLSRHDDYGGLDDGGMPD
jgi:hypothetical protein